MRAGLLTEQIDIQEPPSGVGTRGQQTGNWSTPCASMPAQVKELAGKELELSRQYLPTASHEVIIRWHPDVTSQCRVAWGDRTLAIGYVKNPDNRKNWLHLTCEELL